MMMMMMMMAMMMMMMMMKSVFWWRKPEYPEETYGTIYSNILDHIVFNLKRCFVKLPGRSLLLWLFW